MRSVLMITAALGLLAGAPAFAQKLDANGRCHDASGKFAKMDACKGVTPAHTYRLDGKGKCRDEKGHYSKAEFCPAKH